MHKLLPDLVYLKTLIRYNPDTGVFHWVGRMNNKQAGTLDEKGYVLRYTRISSTSSKAQTRNTAQGIY
jgi:hypothetical protein